MPIHRTYFDAFAVSLLVLAKHRQAAQIWFTKFAAGLSLIVYPVIISWIPAEKSGSTTVKSDTTFVQALDKENGI